MTGMRPRDRYGRVLPQGSRDELAAGGEPTDVVGSAREARRRGIALFDEQRFFEAHELFEYVWKAKDVEDSARPFWKAVTQVAVGCCHAQRGNDRGALAVLERAIGELGRYPAPHGGIDTAALIILAREVAEQIRQRGASADLDFPKFPTV